MSGSFYPNNTSVADIYKSVIADVINQVREAFLDENVDVDVLQQLKKEWEDKVNISGCVELEPRNTMMSHVSAPPMRPLVRQVPIARMPSGSQQVQGILSRHPGHVGMQMEQGQPGPVPVQMQYPAMHQGIGQLPGQHVQAVNLAGQTIVAGGGVHFQQGMRVVSMQGQQAFLPNQQQMVVMQNANGQSMQSLPFNLPPSAIPQIRVQQQMHQQHHQIDGNGDRDCVAVNTELGSSSRIKQKKKTQKPSPEAQKVLSQILAKMQLDGGGTGMSDSSSEEEEEENDPLRRIADKIGGDGAVDEGEAAVEEDPLNSEDDDQDDEDLETIFEADHIIMCLFEKVHRARNKWKFTLKDGIMNINNRDYCFQRCTGDAEW